MEASARVVIKISDLLSVPYDDELRSHLATDDQDALDSVGAQFPFPVEITRYYTEVDPSAIAALVDEARLEARGAP
jgi:hypothetical protein